MQIIEFFSGIGGFAEALRQLQQSHPEFANARIVRAVDIDQSCGEVYQSNFGHAPIRRSIESTAVVEGLTRDIIADTWWLSPPCQPYCRRGSCDPANDPRAQPIRALLTWLEQADDNRLPRRLMLENVPEFEASSDASRLRSFLKGRGYNVREIQLCPSMLGIPNRRMRYYLIASRDVLPVALALPLASSTLRFAVRDVLDKELPDDVWLTDSFVDQFRPALDVVDALDPNAVTACFASGYGRSAIRSGSCVLDVSHSIRLRRFSPREVARLLGFADPFLLPSSLSTRRHWKLLGNSLSIPVVRYLLQAFHVRDD